jgi:hypothetical protein
VLTTNLKGGLGNQMFQYATGRYLSIKTGSELFLDTHWFSKEKEPNGDIEREFELNHFNIQAKIAIQEEVSKIRNPHGKLSEIFRKFEKKFLNRHYLDYHPTLLKKYAQKLIAHKNVYLNGFFQSEKNFAEIRDILLREFTLKPEFQSELFKQITREISEQKNSVSIHIRRGDYIKNNNTNKYHGVCSLSYYEKAIELISDEIIEPKFYIFSDDPEWAKENLKIKQNYEIISGRKLSMQEEMILMSNCKHNIIANSTFSWWGAWLNQNSGKIVIAPTPWVDKQPNPHKNILPETWLQISKN